VVLEAEVRGGLRAEVLAAAPWSEAVYEFCVSRANERADVGVFGTTIDGFEIKTERDTLKRLPQQAAAYSGVFDRRHAVLACRQVDKALETLPPWLGVQVIDEGPSFSLLRPAGRNNSVDPETLIRLLWRDEVYAAPCELGLPRDPRVGRFRL